MADNFNVIQKAGTSPVLPQIESKTIATPQKSEYNAKGIGDIPKTDDAPRSLQLIFDNTAGVAGTTKHYIIGDALGLIAKINDVSYSDPVPEYFGSDMTYWKKFWTTKNMVITQIKITGQDATGNLTTIPLQQKLRPFQANFEGNLIPLPIIKLDNATNKADFNPGIQYFQGTITMHDMFGILFDVIAGYEVVMEITFGYTND